MKDKKIDKIEVLDIQGKLVLRKDISELKNQLITVSIRGLESGVYFLKAYSGEENVVLKFIKNES